METYFALIENGVVNNTIVADEWPGGVNITDLKPRPGIGWSYDGTTFTPPAAPPAPEPEPPKRWISVLAFWQRLMPGERVDIDLLSIHNAALAIDDPANVRAAQLRDLRQQLNSATYIDLDRQDTRDGVAALPVLASLAAERVSVILDAPIQPHEVYHP